jgi:hypothetical protein
MLNLTPGQIVHGKYNRSYEVRDPVPDELGYLWLKEVGRAETVVPHRVGEIRVKGRVG